MSNEQLEDDLIPESFSHHMVRRRKHEFMYPLDKVRSLSWGFDPFGAPRIAWEYIIYVAALVSIWETPFEWIFIDRHYIKNSFPWLLVDLLFLVDVFISQRTGIFVHGIVKLDKESIDSSITLKRRILYWITPIPFYLFGLAFKTDYVYKCLVLLKILRFWRLKECYTSIRGNIAIDSALSHFFILFSVFFTILVFSTCIYWLIGHEEDSEQSWLHKSGVSNLSIYAQFFHTLYYVITTTLTIGYGDMHPYTFGEVVFVIILECIGVFYYNLMISTLVNYVAIINQNSLLVKFKYITTLLGIETISDQGFEQLYQYFEYIWDHDRNRMDFYKNASKLPVGLQERLEMAMYMDVFNKIEKLQNKPEEILAKIALLLRPRIFMQGDRLTQAGKVSRRMYFIKSGRVCVLSSQGSLVSTLEDNSVIGENSVFNGRAETTTIFADTFVEGYELVRSDFNELAETYPELKPSTGGTEPIAFYNIK